MGGLTMSHSHRWGRWSRMPLKFDGPLDVHALMLARRCRCGQFRIKVRRAANRGA